MSVTDDERHFEIIELTSAMASGAATSEALLHACLERIDALDQQGPSLNAIAYLDPDAAENARILDRERADGRIRGSLHGIPILIKDNHDVAGWPTHAGCRGLEGLVAERDAEVVARLRAAGALLFGKTNLHELAAGITTVSSAHGATRNPYDPSRNPGGSSGGSSAAVAAGFAPVAMGSDTCGSIRVPAAHCSLYGLRVTQDMTPMQGVVPLSLTQDVLGPLARNPSDLAMVLDVITEPPLATTWTASLHDGQFKGTRIGRLTQLFDDHAEATEICAVVDRALDEMKSMGAEIIDLDLPELSNLLDENFLVILGDIANDLQGYFDAHPTAPVDSLEALFATNSIHPEVAPVIAGALSAPIRQSPEYAEAIGNRARLREEVVRAMDANRISALAYPPILRTAALLGEVQEGSNASLSANSGLPAISMPAGFSADGLPIGIELLARPREDAWLLALAQQWHGYWRTQAKRPL